MAVALRVWIAAATLGWIIWCSGLAAAQSIALPVNRSAPAGRHHGPIVVRAEAGMEKLAGQVIRRAPGILKSISSDLVGLPQPERIEIRLVKESKSLPRAAPDGYGAPSWAAGVAYPGAGVVVVATRRGGNPIDVLSTTAHELAHLALGAALHDNVPRWLNEGFAYLHASDWSLERLRTLTGMAWSGNVIPMSDLDRSFPAQETQVGRAYAQSYDFVAYLANRGRYRDQHDDGDRWAFQQFLRALSQGDSVYGAARSAYNATFDELFAEWYQNLRQRYLLMPVGLFVLGVWVIAAMLLVFAYYRRRRQNKRRLAQWAIDEAGRAGSGEPEVAASSTLQQAPSQQTESQLAAQNDIPHRSRE